MSTTIDEKTSRRCPLADKTRGHRLDVLSSIVVVFVTLGAWAASSLWSCITFFSVSIGVTLACLEHSMVWDLTWALNLFLPQSARTYESVEHTKKRTRRKITERHVLHSLWRFLVVVAVCILGTTTKTSSISPCLYWVIVWTIRLQKSEVCQCRQCHAKSETYDILQPVYMFVRCVTLEHEPHVKCQPSGTLNNAPCSYTCAVFVLVYRYSVFGWRCSLLGFTYQGRASLFIYKKIRTGIVWKQFVTATWPSYLPSVHWSSPAGLTEIWWTLIYDALLPTYTCFAFAYTHTRTRWFLSFFSSLLSFFSENI